MVEEEEGTLVESASRLDWDRRRMRRPSDLGDPSKADAAFVACLLNLLRKVCCMHQVPSRGSVGARAHWEHLGWHPVPSHADGMTAGASTEQPARRALGCMRVPDLAEGFPCLVCAISGALHAAECPRRGHVAQPQL